jgi:hypothetical protein
MALVEIMKLIICIFQTHKSVKAYDLPYVCPNFILHPNIQSIYPPFPRHIHKPHSKPSQTHSNSHTITMHQHNRWQPLTQHLQVPKIRLTSRFIMTGPLHGTRQCSKHHRGIATLPLHQLVQYQMLCTTRKVVKRQRQTLRRVCGSATT